MNYLVHLFLADGTPASLIGNMMGDFVKGRLGETFPPAIRRGIEMHRWVDAFAHDNPVYRRSKCRIDDRYGYFRGIMIDIFYDHFLARNWHRHHPLPLADFASGVYRLLQEHFELLPPGLQQVAPRMIAHNWLVSYSRVETVSRVLERLSGRLRRDNPLARGSIELELHYTALEGDCEEFLADAKASIAEWNLKTDQGQRP